MNDALMYFLKVNIAIALFYVFYRLVFYNDTFWLTRRFYLVFSMLLSVSYPFISLSGWLEKQEPMQTIITNYVQLNEITVTATPTATPYTLENGLLVIYGLVSTFLLARMMVQLISIIRWRLKGKRQIVQGVEIIAIDGTITPFSFFTTIFMNPALHTDQETRQILIHERTHARQRHSLDVLLSEMLTIACWINPTVWLLKHEIRHNLEFLADNSVLQSGIEPKNYQYHLLQLSCQTPNGNLVNKFNVSPLKKRITMMNQQKTKKAGILKYALIVPLALALVLSSNAETLVNKAKEVISKKGAESADTTKTTNTITHDSILHSQVKFVAPNLKAKTLEDDKVYKTVDKKPEYPGGEDAMWAYIKNNMNYPMDIEVKEVVRFIINKYGKIEQAKISQSNSKSYPQLVSMDIETLRVVNSMPEWSPGEKNGKKVAVYYTLPIYLKKTTKTTYPVIKRDDPQNDKPQEVRVKSSLKMSPTVIMYDDPNYDKPQEETVYEKADKMPQYPDGDKELLKYIARSLKYPVEAQSNGIQGTVIVQFIVVSNGRVAHPVVVKSIMINAKKTEQPSEMTPLEKEALRIIKTLPDFIPGEIKGKKVAVFYTLPITFKLE